MNLPNSLSVTRIFLVPLLVVVLLTKFEGRMIFGVRKELVAAAIFGHRLAHRLARRIPRAAPRPDHRTRSVHRSLRRQAAHDCRVHLARADGSRAGVDGGDHHRPRVRGHRAASLAHARGAAMPASPLGKIKMVSQIVAILALILGKDHLHGFAVIGQIALWVVVLTALVSAADYFRRFGKFLIPKT
ncbi:MAG: hypothetical protein QM736_17495 [Vicinamibacterales bacterium]